MNYNINYICVLVFGVIFVINFGGSMFGQQSTVQIIGGLFVLFVFSISFGVKILGFGGNLYMY